MKSKTSAIVALGCFVVGIFLTYAKTDFFGSNHKAEILKTVSTFREGLETRQYHNLRPLIADEILIRTPSENVQISKSKFIQRLAESNYAVSSATSEYQSHEITGDKATVCFFERIVLNNGTGNPPEHTASYTYHLLNYQGRWIIFEIEQSLMK